MLNRMRSLRSGIVLTLSAIAACELISVLVYWGVTGEVYRPSIVAQRRAEAAASADESVAPGRQPYLPEHLQEVVLHPFIGFVGDPRRDPGFSDLGFWGSRGEPLPARKPGRLVVAILGGSVSAELAEKAGSRLAGRLRGLSGSPDVQVFIVACGGYKQPQQLNALGWLLALGAQFDIVVNLDGFNDVALDAAENQPAGVFYGYPRAWSQLTAGTADISRLRAAARLLARRELRAAVARSFDWPLVRSFASASVVWTLIDRGLARAVAESAALVLRSPATTYASSGPTDHFASPEERLAALVALWARSSLLTDRLCRGVGARYNHFLQPNQYVPGSKPLSRAERATSLDPNSPYRAAIVQGYPQLRAAGAELRRTYGVAFTDLSDLFRETHEPLYVDTCCHLNDVGYSRLADAIADVILQKRGQR